MQSQNVTSPRAHILDNNLLVGPKTIIETDNRITAGIENGSITCTMMVMSTVEFNRLFRRN
jgi:hypothetical protein